MVHELPNIGGVEGIEWSKTGNEVLISKPSLQVSGYRMFAAYIPKGAEYKLSKNDTIVVALRGGLVEPFELGLLESQILKDASVKSGDGGALLWLCEDLGDNGIMRDKFSGLPLEWKHISEMIPTKEYKEKDMYYSRPQLHLGDYRINFWYLGPNLRSGIHNHSDDEVPFLEVHTQLRGFAFMEIFKEEKYETMMRKVPMVVGFTHEPFWKTKDGKPVLNEKGNPIYPFHQYKTLEQGAFWIVFEDTKIL
jgi:hypothetical protein